MCILKKLPYQPDLIRIILRGRPETNATLVLRQHFDPLLLSLELRDAGFGPLLPVFVIAQRRATLHRVAGRLQAE